MNENETLSINQKRKKAVVAIVLFLSILFFMIFLVNLLLFGNPQWHKIIYMAQIKWGGKEPDIPVGYNGKWIDWYKNGQKKTEGNYVNGRKEGIHLAWNPNGQKRYEGEFKNGEAVGTHIIWYEGGSIWGEFYYEKHGIWHGVIKGYCDGKERSFKISILSRFIDAIKDDTIIQRFKSRFPAEKSRKKRENQ